MLDRRDNDDGKGAQDGGRDEDAIDAEAGSLSCQLVCIIGAFPTEPTGDSQALEQARPFAVNAEETERLTCRNGEAEYAEYVRDKAWCHDRYDCECAAGSMRQRGVAQDVGRLREDKARGDHALDGAAKQRTPVTRDTIRNCAMMA